VAISEDMSPLVDVMKALRDGGLTETQIGYLFGVSNIILILST